MTVLYPNSSLCGLQIKLTKSQSENHTIIQNHWIHFNTVLKKNNLTQNKGNWVKYGVTFKVEDTYYYLAAIPSSILILPEHFTTITIPQGNYHIFTHRGKMEGIKETLNDIYKIQIPKLNLQIQSSEKIGFIHFEKYDYRFQWNNPASTIELYLPLEH